MAAPLVVLEGVTKAYGTRVLLDGVTVGVGPDERIGIVGRNGGGKTTLLEVLTGHEPPDAGRVVPARDLRVAYLRQHDALPPDATVRDVVLGDRPEHVWAGDAAARDVLEGLLGGLDVPALPEGLDARVGALSGGERRRVALAALLLDPCDLLVFDEPTNHLDVQAVDWLARHLASSTGPTRALLVVTHDRWFLDAVCTRTWEVTDGGVAEYDGGYAAYVLARAERTRVAAADEARRANLLRKELAWLRRGPPARTSKPRFRIEAANALIAGEPPPRDRVELVRFASARLGRTVYELDAVTLTVGDRTLLDRLSWIVGPGERLGVVGVNGAGKTSLLRLLLGELAPSVGRVERGVTVRPAYLSQAVTELPAGRRVLEAVEDVRASVDLGNGRALTASALCERFGFAGERRWTPVRDLSGGERRRLQLLRLLMREPNVLLLDEPTNDLDIETLTALEDLLDGWAGTLLVVSHDRYFLERVCDRTVALLGDGRLRDLPGGVEEYLERRRALVASGPAPDRGATAAPAPASATAQERAARKELARIERRLDRLAAREASLHDALAAAATDYAALSGLDDEFRALVRERDELEERWLILAEEAG